VGWVNLLQAMIIGNGDIASVLNDREGALFFASGVSNSVVDDSEVFMRERDLLSTAWEKHHDKCIFYFSTISKYFKFSPYIHHKYTMESIIKSRWENYNIIRIGNITWGDNPNTFINYIRSRKKNGRPFVINDEYKYLINKEQLLLLTDNLPLNGKNEIAAFGTCKKVIDCI
jgi:hypothetical protein